MGWPEDLSGPAYARGMTLPVVGIAYLNADGSNRQFEVMTCVPGEAVSLEPEPRNKHDRFAIAVKSVRGVQIGYLPAERAPWIGSMIRAGREISAIFQQATPYGAAIRLAMDGHTPVLPEEPAVDPLPADDGFWADYIPPDD